MKLMPVSDHQEKILHHLPTVDDLNYQKNIGTKNLATGNIGYPERIKLKVVAGNVNSLEYLIMIITHIFHYLIRM